MAFLVFGLILLSASIGCRTASSLGLPISSGNHLLLSDAAEIRHAYGHSARLPTELAKVALEPHRIEAGDVLVIEPNDFNSPVRMQSDQTVQQDGTIDLGSYGRVYVAGRTTAEIQHEIESVVRNVEYAKRERLLSVASFDQRSIVPLEELDLGVSVRLINQESSNIYVMGEVNAPGSYPIDGHETVLDALISAGGLSSNANDHKIILTRPRHAGESRIVLPVCCRQIVQLGDVSTNYQLRPGDRIFVPSMNLVEDITQSLNWRHEKSCPHCRDYSE